MSASSAPGRWIFDAAVVIALLSAVAMVVTGRWEGAVRFVLIAGFMISARGGGAPAPFAAAFAVFLLLATWASVLHWYRELGEFDVLVHFLTPGSLAAVAYFSLLHARLLPSASPPFDRLRSWAPVLWVTLVGVTAAVLWEFYEWVIEQINPRGMIVGYTDTVLDLLAGLLGSLVAGALVLAWARRHPTATPDTR